MEGRHSGRGCPCRLTSAVADTAGQLATIGTLRTQLGLDEEAIGIGIQCRELRFGLGQTASHQFIHVEVGIIVTVQRVKALFESVDACEVGMLLLHALLYCSAVDVRAVRTLAGCQFFAAQQSVAIGITVLQGQLGSIFMVRQKLIEIDHAISIHIERRQRRTTALTACRHRTAVLSTALRHHAPTLARASAVNAAAGRCVFCYGSLSLHLHAQHKCCGANRYCQNPDLHTRSSYRLDECVVVSSGHAGRACACSQKRNGGPVVYKEVEKKQGTIRSSSDRKYLQPVEFWKLWIRNNMPDAQQINHILTQLQQYSDDCGYRGYNKHDGLNSPLLRLILGWGPWPRLIAIQGVMRFPINLRPLLLVPKTYNPKGLALFATGFLDRWRYDGDPVMLQEARKLLALLESLGTPEGRAGICWGYHYPWQDPGFYAPARLPNAVVSCFVCESFLDAYRVTGERHWLDVVRSCLEFFMRDLQVLKDTPDELCLGYMPLPMTMRVMDVSILIGTVIAQYNALAGDTVYNDEATRLVRYVVNRQTDYGAWYYTDPPGDSHITHDNYHTGFILDALDHYMRATGKREWQTQYDRGLEFYATHHFGPDGEPYWTSEQKYPYDIHGAAQGILTFSRHRDRYPGLAQKVADWAIDNMYMGNGRFAYQQTRWFRKSFTLLRWCNAWMFRALTTLQLPPPDANRHPQADQY
jgi:hypothetical protein